MNKLKQWYFKRKSIAAHKKDIKQSLRKLSAYESILLEPQEMKALILDVCNNRVSTERIQELKQLIIEDYKRNNTVKQ